MSSVRRIRELFSTLRFRLALWITLVVFVMVVVKNVLVGQIAERILHSEYDQFLQDSLEEVNSLVHRQGFDDMESLAGALTAKVRAYETRSWFLQLHDSKGKLIWGSTNAPVMPPPNFREDVRGPFDGTHHRIMERREKKENGEYYYLRCGFLQLDLVEDISLLHRNLFIASVSILIFAPLGGYFIGLVATRPIAKIINTAAHLQPSRMTERLPIRGSGDELDQLSHTINGMLDRLASFIDQNRDFVANAAHELRSPLAAIRTSVEVGLNQTRSPEEYTALLVDVLEEITRLAGLVNRLLILAEADAGRVVPKHHVTRLEKIVLESVMMFDAVAETKDIRIETGQLTPAVVRGEESFVRQVVRNLIDNAIKYNRSPGAVFVDLKVDAAKKQARLVVQDFGIGIEAAHLPRVFERFFRADKSRTREPERAGYGLGLSICKTIVTALGGEILVTSEVGKGTTFTVILPLAEEPTSLTQSGENRLAGAAAPKPAAPSAS